MVLPYQHAFPALAGLSPERERSSAMTSIRNRSISGKRTIIPMSTVPVWTWKLPYNFLRSKLWEQAVTNEELETLLGFYNARSADGLVFTYTDADDNIATEQGFGQGDGASTQFQLYRTFGGYVEPVYAPSLISSLTIDGVAVFEPGDWEVGQTGIITFAVAPGLGAQLAWTGTFDWVVRFDTDMLSVARIIKGLYKSGDEIVFSNEINL